MSLIIIVAGFYLFRCRVAGRINGQYALWTINNDNQVEAETYFKWNVVSFVFIDVYLWTLEDVLKKEVKK